MSVEEISKRMVAITNTIGAKFTLKGRSITPTEIFSPTGLLPGISRRADQLASLCFGYSLGANYEDAEKTLLGSTVSYDDFTPDVLRLFCLTDVLYELIKSSPNINDVSLDELMYD